MWWGPCAPPAPTTLTVQPSSAHASPNESGRFLSGPGGSPLDRFAIAAAFLGSLIVFGLLRTIGGDVALIMLGQEAAPGAYEALRVELGLDQPWYTQYFDWLIGVFTGDLGTSYSVRFDIYEEIVRWLEPTALLAFGSLALSVPLALVLGTYSAIKVKKIRGGVVDVLSQIGLPYRPSGPA